MHRYERNNGMECAPAHIVSKLDSLLKITYLAKQRKSYVIRQSVDEFFGLWVPQYIISIRKARTHAYNLMIIFRPCWFRSFMIVCILSAHIRHIRQADCISRIIYIIRSRKCAFSSSRTLR